MSHAHVIWDELPWQQGNHPLEHKKLSPEKSCVLLMFMPGFSDQHWCSRSHVLHVLEGALTIELEGASVRVRAGELLLLEPNTPHRAANADDEPVQILALSDAPLRF